LGFLAVFIHGQGLFEEDGPDNDDLDVYSLGKIGTLEERITSLKKREAEAGKKDRERQNSKRRTKKLNRKSELNESKKTKFKKTHKKTKQEIRVE